MADLASVLMVAELMTESMASVALQERLMLRSVADEFQELESVISIIRSVLLDAEQLWSVEEIRMTGLPKRIENAVYEADDILGDFFTAALGRRLMSENKTATRVRSFFSLGRSSKPTIFQPKMISDMKKATKVLEKVLFAAKDFHEVRKSIERARQETRPIFVREEDVIGRDSDKEEIVKLALGAAHNKTNQKLTVVPILGIQGIGKTTLAQLVYNDAAVTSHFDLRMWACVSDLADASLIVQKLVESAKDVKVRDDDLQWDHLQEQLCETLNGKRFFLVLDDVRYGIRANWMSLKNLLMAGAKGSTVLVTTRSAKVVNIMRTNSQSYHLRSLKDEDSLFLLEAMALGTSQDQKHIQAFTEIGRQIAGKCKGVPLVIQNVGSSMAHKSVDDWQSFLHEEKISQIMKDFSSANSLTTVALRKVTKGLDKTLFSTNKFQQVPKTMEKAKQETRAIFVREEDVIGRDSDREEIMKLVLKEAADTESTEQKLLSVVSVVGVEGIGKTTLAQLVYNDAAVASHFNLRMWVCIPHSFDLRVIIQTLIESAEDEKVRDDNLQLDHLKEQLWEALNGKRFFLVLDDVPHGIGADWEALKDLLMAGASGSTVLVTTRSKKVAKIMRTVSQSYHLGPLNDADSSFLLETLAFGISADRELVHAFKEIGRQIAGKCKGVPLVIQNVGSSMAHKSVDDWQSFLHEEKISQIMKDFSSPNSLTTVALRKVMKGLDKAFFSTNKFQQVPKTMEKAKQETRAIFVREEDVIGRDSDREEIMKLVLKEAADTESTEQKLLRVVPVVGVEGIGKTTLARLVYNDAAVASHFNLRMWVCIPHSFDLRVIIQKLIESAEVEEVRDDDLQMDHLKEQLWEALNGKRFFLVLDDLRYGIEADWEGLKDLLMAGASGSTVLVTTRSTKVAKAMRTVSQSYPLGPLNDADSLFLLETLALRISADRERVHAFKEIGRQIAGKCEGVPLFIQKVGSSMASKSVDEWQSFLHEETYSPSVPKEEVIGREADKEAIMKQLMEPNSEDNTLTIPIVGVAGIGKTALAQLIINDSQVRSHFDLSVWISVSGDFDLKVIMEKILEYLTTTDPGQLQVGELQSMIHKEILGKRCLLVLDDVWNVESEEWSHLWSLLSVGANGSRVIVTTRNENVTVSTASEKHENRLEPLDEKQSWSLFEKVAFEESRQPTNLKIGREIVKKIVDKRGGIPFTTRTVGGILYSKSTETEWQSFYEKELPKILDGENVQASLQLSYDQLPSFLKPCFAYCALFPQDYEFDVQTLINLWMSQGFIRPHPDLDLEAVGYQYFVELLRRSFFQETMRDGLGYITKCKMKNLKCTDLAKEVAQNVCATFGLKEERKGENLHVSFDFHVEATWHIRLPAESERIRSLVLPRQTRQEVEGRSSESVCEEIAKFKYLRMLDLHNSGIKVVSDLIGDLKYLRYLDLSQNISIKALPDSIGRLGNLQTLKLNHCSKLEKLPRAITKLGNLRNLENESCYGLTSMPRGLGQLTSLRRLSEFVLSNGTGSVSNKNGKLDELEKLNKLRGKLKIINLGYLGGDGTKRAKLNEKEHLVSLVLVWDSNAAIKESHCQELEFLRPHQNLRELSLFAYGGVRFSSWLPKHENLVKFSLSKCRSCQSLPPLDHLFCLEVLVLDNLPELEYISDKTPKDKSRAFFLSLKELQLTNLPKLARWCNDAAVVEETTFPRLSKLIIEDCPSLIYMPMFPCLEELLVLKNTKWEPLQRTIPAERSPSATSGASSSTSIATVAPLVPLSKLSTLCIINMVNSRLNMWQSLSSLRSLTLDHLQDIEICLEGLEKLTNLQELHIWRCVSLKEISWISSLKSLRILSIKLCPNLTIPRDRINLIIPLQKVEIEQCHQVSHIERMLDGRFYTQ